MENFDEYLRQGEPNKAEKAKVWKTAIGLQKVDGLTPSNYLINTAKQNIEGDITIDEVKQRIDSYYQQHPVKNDENRVEEADKVSARIAEMLGEQTFTFSPAEYLSIHRRLFQDIYSHAGKIRDYNITKKEWVLNGETVLYAGADSLKATLEYDFEQEKKFNYKGLTKQESIEHIAHFISYLWQIHVFGEGNTRTTVVFLIKYLHKLGFTKVNNNLFAEHSWYFRNALVRAIYEDLSNGIYKTEKYLLHFLFNLISKGNYELKNREMHIHFKEAVNESLYKTEKKLEKKSGQKKVVRKSGQKRWSEILDLIKENSRITRNELSEKLKINPSAVQKHLQKLKSDGIIERIGGDKVGSWKIKN